MAHPLVELSRTRHHTGANFVIEDYGKHPRLCRHGVWVGWQTTFTETVLLSYEHDPENLYVGWAINGTTVLDPGYGTGTPPWGAPAPGDPSISYVTPVGGFSHRLSLTSTAGSESECLWVQVLYRTPSQAGQPAQFGPAMSVCLTGSLVAWPSADLEEEKRCLDHLHDLLRRYVRVARVPPWEQVQQWLSHLRGDHAVRFRAEIETLAKLDPAADRELAEAITADLAGQLHARMPGAGLARGLDRRAAD